GGHDLAEEPAQFLGGERAAVLLQHAAQYLRLALGAVEGVVVPGGRLHARHFLRQRGAAADELDELAVDGVDARADLFQGQTVVHGGGPKAGQYTRAPAPAPFPGGAVYRQPSRRPRKQRTSWIGKGPSPAIGGRGRTGVSRDGVRS